MTAQEQYELFLPFYRAEDTRYEDLNKRAVVYLSVISGLALLASLGSEKYLETLAKQPLTYGFAVASALAVFACLFAIILSLRPYRYRGLGDAERLVRDIEKEALQAEDVYEQMLADLVVAQRDNRAINKRRAALLRWAVVFLGLAIAMIVGTFLAALTTLFLKS